MKNIIIVGTSKAGFLHFNSYNQLENRGKIYFVDIIGNSNNKNIETEKVYKNISDVLLENNLSNKEVIVDICIPKEEFYNVINQCINLEINDIIVEKPFVANKEFFDAHPNLNILMIQNYLYSNIVNEIKNEIEKNNYVIKIIHTNFSKNRINDSINGRGMRKKVTQNFEIEIPHQIYLADYILGTNSEKDIIFKEQRDFVIGDVCLKNHGYGKIILKQDDKIIIHESDMTTATTIKEVIIICNKGISINAEFIIYDEDLNIVKNGKVVVKKYDNVIFEKHYEEDNNMFNCLKEYYKYFNDLNISKKYKERIIQFSNIFEKVIEK